MIKLILVFTSFLFTLGFFTISMAAPFQNGSFEEGPDEIGEFMPLSAGDTTITGWTVTFGSIDLIGSYWEASDGDRSIDLNGSEPGSISQEFDTESGAVYRVLFDMGGIPEDSVSEIKALVVSANSETEEYIFDSTEKTKDDMGWTEMSFVFQASSDLTTLEFASNNLEGWYGPALDNVRVIPIGCFPEDNTPPAGAVHAYPNLLWPPNNKPVKVKIKGYVFDEMSAAKDEDGVGVSEAYILINKRKKIILRDETTDLLEPDGSFKVKVPLKAKKDAKYKIQLFATDTAVEEDRGPNEGLVDQTKVVVPRNRGKGDDDDDDDDDDEDDDKKKKKKKKK